MKLFNKVAIIGVGLIGGSMALAIKKKHLANKVIGISRHRNTLRLAKKISAIDMGSCDLKIVKDADLIILATPVNTILEIAKTLSKIIKPDSIVTDVGSTKGEIVSSLKKLFPHYVGSHPLAGSEKRGVLNANANIFKNSLCILTPVKSTHQPSLRKIRKLWNVLGARVVYIEPSLHDSILSFVSHLPHLIVFSLIGAVPKKYLKFAAAGFKDTTRIASSDAMLWRDIFLSNQKNILKAIEFFQDNLTRIKNAIQKKDKKSLIRILKQAKNKRDSLN